ncbi:uncharacterized protein LOC114581196 [Dendrobium catenatum]|uniref:uncharacterized protein LOC114581196 n=1 Tax=Dendrobium catenatum TaxID=906689 RepID=UPI0010A09D0E|nr:uncharacterized protein LOC114581196 [Dendrobium catenatum]
MIEDITRTEVDRLIGNNWDFFHFPAVGRSGGQLALWRRDTTQFVVVSMMDQAIVGYLMLPNFQKWGIALVYASKSYHSHRLLWNTIGSSLDVDLPMIVRGDFNCCLDQSEKKGGRWYSYSVVAQEMAAFIVDNDLHDLGFIGPRFTWTNNKAKNSKIWVRLDRVLMNSEGLRLAPLATIKHLLRLSSDHCPMLLNLMFTSLRIGNRWYRFEDICHIQLLGNCWNRSKELGNLKNSLEARLEELQELETSNDGLNEA